MALALKGFEGNAIRLGMVLFDWREKAKVFGRCFKDASVFFGFAGLFVELRFCSVIAIVAGLRSKFRIHRGVFVGFAFDGKLKAAAEQDLFVVVAERAGVADYELRMEQPKVSKGVLCTIAQLDTNMRTL